MDENKNESLTASVAALQAFGRQVGQEVLAGIPSEYGVVGPRVIDFAARTAAAKLRAKGYSAVQANVAALAASDYVRSARP